MKKCTKCGIEKPLSEFYKTKIKKDGFHSCCKICSNEANKKTKEKDPQKYAEMRRKNKLKKYYGLTLSNFNALKIKQKNCCAICENKLKDGQGTHVDHCHKTGIVRGLLCNSCNRGIGYLQDSIEILKSAQKYLKKYSVKTTEK